VERTLFAAKKLSSIEISATDENGRPLPNEAVVSISDTTGGNFRTSEHMKEGVAHFPSLLPGEYYVRVVLKEWLFEPKSIVINLGEHENAKRTVSGKRVAYSLHGSLQVRWWYLSVFLRCVLFNGKDAPYIHHVFPCVSI
jgi:hypothetical protein